MQWTASRAAGARERGVALAIVVWFVAGMSLLVAGIVAQARVDTRMAQLHMARAKAVAAGDGAIQLRMFDSLGRPGNAGRPVDGPSRYRLGNLSVEVSLVPTAGLIDLNTANVKLLQVLFVEAGGLSADEAKALADNVVKWRGNRTIKGARRGRNQNFEVPEDLLRVPGGSRAVFDAVRDFVVAGSPAAGDVDPGKSPANVRTVLSRAGLTPSRRSGLGTRESEDVDTISGKFRVDAVVFYGDETWLRRRWVSTGDTANSALPWRFLRTEPARVVRP